MIKDLLPSVAEGDLKFFEVLGGGKEGKGEREGPYAQ